MLQHENACLGAGATQWACSQDASLRHSHRPHANGPEGTQLPWLRGLSPNTRQLLWLPPKPGPHTPLPDPEQLVHPRQLRHEAVGGLNEITHTEHSCSPAVPLCPRADWTLPSKAPPGGSAFVPRFTNWGLCLLPSHRTVSVALFQHVRKRTAEKSGPIFQVTLMAVYRVPIAERALTVGLRPTNQAAFHVVRGALCQRLWSFENVRSLFFC